jgi:glycosyltransferase involved in cell wall biosynthesis
MKSDSINVTLLGNNKKDGSLSMHLYEKDIVSRFSANINLQVISPNTSQNWFIRFFHKHIIYPFYPTKGDIVHIIDQSYGHLFFFHPSKYKVITCHDIIPLKVPGACGFFGKLLFRLYICGLKKADRIIAISKQTKKDLVSIGVDKKKIIVAESGIDSKFKKSKSLIYKDKKTKYILSIGTIFYKNIISVLKCLKEIQSQNSKYKYVLLKVGKLSELEKEFVRVNGLGKNVKIFQNISDEKLIELYSTADVLLFPSLYEGFGRPVIEAMACQCPVITSNNGSLPDVAGNSAILVDAFDIAKMAKYTKLLCENSKLRNKYIKLGLTNCKRFSWDKHVKVIEDVYAKKK